MRRLTAVPAALAGLLLLGACGDQDPLTISVGQRVVYSEAAAAQPATAVAVAGTPGSPAAPAAGGGVGLRMPTITSNIPVFIGDRQVGGPGMPADPAATP